MTQQVLTVNYSQAHLIEQFQRYLSLQADCALPTNIELRLFLSEIQLKSLFDVLTQYMAHCKPSVYVDNMKQHLEILRPLLQDSDKLGALKKASVSQLEYYQSHLDQLEELFSAYVIEHYQAIDKAPKELQEINRYFYVADEIVYNRHGYQQTAKMITEHGLCHGFTILWLYLKTYGNSVLATSFSELFKGISTWDGMSLNITIANYFEKAIAWLRFLHAKMNLFGHHTQASFLDNVEFIRPVAPENKQQKFTQSEGIVNQQQDSPLFLLDGENKVVDENQEIRLATFSGVLRSCELLGVFKQYVKPERGMLISTGNHAIGVYLKQGVYYYYNSNRFEKATACNTLEELIDCFTSDNYKNVTANSYLPVNFLVLRTPTQSVEFYPDLITLLKSFGTSYPLRVATHNVDDNPLALACRYGPLSKITAHLRAFSNTYAQLEKMPSLLRTANNFDIVLDTTQKLLKIIDLNKVTDEGGTTLLHYYAYREANDKEQQQTLQLIEQIKQFISIDAQNNVGSTPLNIACSRGHTLMPQILLQAGANVNLANKQGKTPLMQVVEQGNHLVFEALLAHNADITVVSARQESALSIAVKMGRLAMFEQLCQLHADQKITIDYSNLLHIALRHNQLALIRRLLSLMQRNGLSLDHIDEQGSTFLHDARSVYAATLLLTYLASENDLLTQPNHNGMTPALSALTHGAYDCASFLIQQGGLSPTKHHVKLTRQNLAAMSKPMAWPTMQLLIQQSDTQMKIGASLLTANIINVWLQFAVQLNNPLLLECLLRYATPKDEVVTINAWQGTLLQWAIQHGYTDVAIKLIDAKYSVLFSPSTSSRLQTEKHSAAHLAAIYGQTTIVEYLLNFHKDLVDFQDSDGNTPLYYAVKNHDIETAQLIAKFQPDLFIKNNNGQTCYDAMRENARKFKDCRFILLFANELLQFQCPNKLQGFENMLAHTPNQSQTDLVINLFTQHARSQHDWFGLRKHVRAGLSDSIAIVKVLSDAPHKWQKIDIQDLLTNYLQKTNLTLTEDFTQRILFCFSKIFTGQMDKYIHCTQPMNNTAVSP
ncbi:MAG: hypothetical protein Tsb005_06380 [Gammaproteobacteria bacterium]